MFFNYLNAEHPIGLALVILTVLVIIGFVLNMFIKHFKKEINLMLMNSVIALTFLTASSNNGGLNIDVQQEEEKRINNDLNQYDTTLFNKDSKAVNDAIVKQKKERQQQIKNDMFQNQASHSTRLNETKKCYFPNLT